jgi:hypothetical protein
MTKKPPPARRKARSAGGLTQTTLRKPGLALTLTVVATSMPADQFIEAIAVAIPGGHLLKSARQLGPGLQVRAVPDLAFAVGTDHACATGHRVDSIRFDPGDFSNPIQWQPSARWFTEIHGESCITASSWAVKAGAMYSHETGDPGKTVC